MMPDQILPPPKPQRGMVIRGLTPQLPERGKIKIGALGDARPTRAGGEFRPPVKFDHFVITTMERDKAGNLIRDEEMHARFGDNPVSLPVRLLYDDPTLNFPTRYACYKGRTLWCSGDGVSAQRLNDKGARYEVECTCPLADPAIKRGPTEMRCKMNGALSVLIEGGSGLGGVWKFRTTSYNSIVGLLSSMAFLRQVTGGPLANIPLVLTVRGRQAANPVDGSAVRIFVVGLEFAGDMEALQSEGHRIALARATTHMSIEHIEEEARRALALAPPSAPLPNDDAGEDIVAEYYPEQIIPTEAPPRPQREDFVEHEPAPEPEKPYAFADLFGEVHEFHNSPDATHAYKVLLASAKTAAELEASWENGTGMLEEMLRRGGDELVEGISALHANLLYTFKSRDSAGAPPAADDGMGDANISAGPPAEPESVDRQSVDQGGRSPRNQPQAGRPPEQAGSSPAPAGATTRDKTASVPAGGEDMLPPRDPAWARNKFIVPGATPQEIVYWLHHFLPQARDEIDICRIEQDSAEKIAAMPKAYREQAAQMIEARRKELAT